VRQRQIAHRLAALRPPRRRPQIHPAYSLSPHAAPKQAQRHKTFAYKISAPARHEPRPEAELGPPDARIHLLRAERRRSSR
jgi:hypothetical protein